MCWPASRRPGATANEATSTPSVQKEQIKNVAAPKFTEQIRGILVKLNVTYEQMLNLSKRFPPRLVG